MPTADEQVIVGGQRALAVTEVSGDYIYDGGSTDIQCIVESDDKAQRAIKVVILDGGEGPLSRKTIIKDTTIPTASDKHVGEIYIYAGETNANYTHGYIYECKPTYTDTAVTFSSENITWSLSDFTSWLTQAEVAYNRVTHGTMSYEAAGNLWTVEGFDADGLKVFTWKEYTEDLEEAGCVFATEPQDGDSSTFTFTTTESGYIWVRVDVQPGGGSPIVVDQSYSASSTNAQSGTAVAQALATIPSPTLTWYKNNTGTTVTIADTTGASLVKVYKNGILLEPTADYTISGTTLTLTSALESNDKIITEVL